MAPDTRVGQPTTDELIERIRAALDRHTRRVIDATHDLELRDTFLLKDLASTFSLLGGPAHDQADTVPAEEYARLAAQLADAERVANELDAGGRYLEKHVDALLDALKLADPTVADVIIARAPAAAHAIENLGEARGRRA